jgi:hypothetical protein
VSIDHNNPATFHACRAAFCGRVLLVNGVLAVQLGFAHADPADDSLRLYAVDIWQDPATIEDLGPAGAAQHHDAGRRILVRPGQRCGKRAAQIQVLPELRIAGLIRAPRRRREREPPSSAI